MSILFTRIRRRAEQDRRREERLLAVWRMLSICGLIFLAFAAFLGFTLVLPASLELQSLQQQRESVIQRLNKAQEEEEEARDRFIWMMDPEYFEQIARDRANQAKDGETVIRRPDPTSRPSQQTQPSPRN